MIFLLPTRVKRNIINNTITEGAVPFIVLLSGHFLSELAIWVATWNRFIPYIGMGWRDFFIL